MLVAAANSERCGGAMQNFELNVRLRRAQRLATLTKHEEKFVQSLNYVVHSIKQLRVDRQKATMISPALGSIYETFIELLCESVKFILPNVHFFSGKWPGHGNSHHGLPFSGTRW
ncbi:hypothetical protein [Pseudomonas putida]|uniref:hypothetical protein n=1 Tax=Pseudomonas putida TaxID=303 RepID=UPI0018A92D00|nr:hypothetical protein [Pseudomonas putida]MBF8727946.1 hypothetical protein [Pseudomonas putida]